MNWVKETNRQAIDKSGLPNFNRRKRIFVLRQTTQTDSPFGTRK